MVALLHCRCQKFENVENVVKPLVLFLVIESTPGVLFFLKIFMPFSTSWTVGSTISISWISMLPGLRVVDSLASVSSPINSSKYSLQVALIISSLLMRMSHSIPV